MNERKEDRYKKLINEIRSEGKDKFCPFRKERQMDHLFSSLRNDLTEKKQKILDACCGYGRLLYYLKEIDPEQLYYGIDYIEDLIREGESLFKWENNIRLVCDDVLNMSSKYNGYFDISINYKTLSWLPYYEKIIEQLISVTKKKIYITSLFCDGDIDTIVKIHTKASIKPKDEYSYLNTYSLPKFKDYCLSIGAKSVVSRNMKLDIDLERSSDVNELKTYTIITNDDDRVEVTGNIILNWKLVEIVL